MRIALVTGASSGMGKEFVKIIAGSKLSLDEIWLIARRKDRLQALAEEIAPLRCRILPLDLTDRDDLETLKKELKTVKPKIAVLVHCAGFGVMGNIGAIADEEKMVDLNCRTVVQLTGMAKPYIVRGGRMIYLASAAAFIPQPGFATYAASKAFVLSFVRALRVEMARRRVRITAVCPGAVKTAFFHTAERYVKLPEFKKYVMADPRRVVETAWQDNGRNREVSVYSLPMKAFRLLTKMVPHGMILQIMEMIQQ